MEFPKNSKVLISEYLSPIGHSRINSEIIKDLYNHSKELGLLSHKSYSDRLQIPQIELIKLIFIKRKGKFFRAFNYLLNLFQILVTARDNFDLIILLSFENNFFPLFSHFLPKNSFVFVHNNIDILSKKKGLFKFISKKIVFIAFEDYISEYLNTNFGFHCITYPHPILDNSYAKITEKENIIFAPSSSNKYTLANEEIIDKFLSHNKLVLYTKVNFKSIKSTRIISKSYFVDIDQYFARSKWVLINCNYSYRVSGIFYEAIASNCKVIFADESLFLQKMMLKYPKSVFKLDQFFFDE